MKTEVIRGKTTTLLALRHKVTGNLLIRSKSNPCTRMSRIYSCGSAYSFLKSLEDCLSDDPGAYEKIHEGDTVKITF